MEFQDIEQDDTNNRLSLNQQYVMKEKIEKLNEVHCLELFEIIKKSTDKFTVNKNGVFFNFKDFENTTLQKIHVFLNYIDSVNQTLNEDRFSEA